MSTPTKRVITHHDRQTARRLQGIWTKKKDELNLTQDKIARLCGFSQPTFNQYLHCTIPLNTDVIFKLATVLEVSPEEIDPELKKIKTLFSGRKTIEKRTFPLIGTTSGNRTMLKTETLVDTSKLKDDEVYAGIEITTPCYAESLGYAEGSLLIVGMLANPFKVKQNVALRLINTEEFLIMRVKSLAEETVELLDYAAQATFTIAREKIAQIYAIKMVVAPD